MSGDVVSEAEFGTLLRHYRRRARLTQNELADLSTVSPRTIRNLEAGRAISPRPSTVRLLAQGLRLSAGSQTRLSLAAGQSVVGAALHAAQGQLPSWVAPLDRDPYGREHELRSVLACLHAGTSCLVSICGFGGVGKSRLAAALVREAEHTHHAQWLWLRPDQATEGSAASSMDVTFCQWYRELVDGTPDAADDLARMVGDQQYLIIVDGLDCPSQRFDATLRELIRRCPRLTVIETTRRPVRLEGRHVVPLKPLRLPSATRPISRGLVGHPAMRLLMPLVRSVQPDFQESEENLGHAFEVCRRLDGIPRAIESAATWFAFYPPALVAEAARENPCAVAAPSEEDTKSTWLREAVDDALSVLTDAQRCHVSELASRTAPWTIDDLAGGPGSSSGDTVRFLKSLLALGIIRPADDSDPRRYTVLSLLRHSLE